MAYLTTHVRGGPERLHRLCSNPSLFAEMLRALAVGGAAEEVVQDAKAMAKIMASAWQLRANNGATALTKLCDGRIPRFNSHDELCSCCRDCAKGSAGTVAPRCLFRC